MVARHRTFGKEDMNHSTTFTSPENLLCRARGCTSSRLTKTTVEYRNYNVRRISKLLINLLLGIITPHHRNSVQLPPQRQHVNLASQRVITVPATNYILNEVTLGGRVARRCDQNAQCDCLQSHEQQTKGTH